MKLLQLYKDMFGDGKVLSKFRDAIKEKRSLQNDDRKFANFLINWIGGRSYNGFLDYSLLAIKMNRLFSNEMRHAIPSICWFGKDGDIGDIKDLIGDLLWDDRHDLYQNMPYILDRIYKEMKDGPGKSHFWTLITDAIIDCINVHGTGDVAFKFHIPEGE